MPSPVADADALTLAEGYTARSLEDGEALELTNPDGKVVVTVRIGADGVTVEAQADRLVSRSEALELSADRVVVKGGSVDLLADAEMVIRGAMVRIN